MKKDVRETVRLLHNNNSNLEQQLQFVESRNDLQEVAVYVASCCQIIILQNAAATTSDETILVLRIINLIVMMLE